MELGQYKLDDPFKKKARMHQSDYIAQVLKVDYDDYGNRLTDESGRNYLNYFEGLNVVAEKEKRFPNYSKKRDADMLRSEHIPFNMFAPLIKNEDLAKLIIKHAFNIQCSIVCYLKFEFSPKPKNRYLDDSTAFDTYIKYINLAGEPCGIGIEVKYTEKAYHIGKSEKEKVEDKKSPYWKVTHTSQCFKNNEDAKLGHDMLRQIWRNHILGLSMLQAGDISQFHSVILYPKGNEHFEKAIPEYQSLLNENCRESVFGCTFEKFIDSIEGDNEIIKWKEYLKRRYLIST